MDKISSIETYLETKFEKELFRASVSYLSKVDDPLRLNSFAYSMRELYNHVLSRLSPEDQIIECVWFKSEGKQGNFTRKEKLKYAVQGGLKDDYVKDKLDINIDEFYRPIGKIHNQLSIYTHVDESTFNVSEIDCSRFSNEVLSSLLEIFDLIFKTRNEILDSLQDNISEELIKTCAYNTMGGIDMFSNNSYIEDVEIESYEIKNIDSENIYFMGEGNVTVSLNYNDGEDGVEINTDFPFKFRCLSSVIDTTAIQLTEEDIEIDTSSWNEDE